MITIELDENDFQDALDDLKQIHDNVDDKWLKSTLRRKTKPISTAMKRNSISTRLEKVIGRSVAKKNVGDTVSVKIGVIKNDPNLFPDFSSFALAVVLAHGTPERFRQVTNQYGIIIAEQSTGRIKGRHWLRRSYDQNINKVIKDFEKSIEKRVKKGLKKGQ